MEDPDAPDSNVTSSTLCINKESTCAFVNDGICDDGGDEDDGSADGGIGSLFSVCQYGTDCTDCCPRDPWKATRYKGSLDATLTRQLCTEHTIQLSASSPCLAGATDQKRLKSSRFQINAFSDRWSTTFAIFFIMMSISLFVVGLMVVTVVYSQLVYSGLWPVLTSCQKLRCMITGNFEATREAHVDKEKAHQADVYHQADIHRQGDVYYAGPSCLNPCGDRDDIGTNTWCHGQTWKSGTWFLNVVQERVNSCTCCGIDDKGDEELVVEVKREENSKWGFNVNSSSAVHDVEAGSAAAQAGLHVGDVVIAIDGILLDGKLNHVRDLLTSRQNAMSIAFTIMRKAKQPQSSSTIRCFLHGCVLPLFFFVFVCFYVVKLLSLEIVFDILPLCCDTRFARKSIKFLRYVIGLAVLGMLLTYIPSKSSSALEETLACVLASCQSNNWRLGADTLECEAAQAVGVTQPTFWSDFVDIVQASLSLAVLTLLGEWKGTIEGKNRVGAMLLNKIDRKTGQAVDADGVPKDCAKSPLPKDDALELLEQMREDGNERAQELEDHGQIKAVNLAAPGTKLTLAQLFSAAGSIFAIIASARSYNSQCVLNAVLWGNDSGNQGGNSTRNSTGDAELFLMKPDVNEWVSIALIVRATMSNLTLITIGVALKNFITRTAAAKHLVETVVTGKDITAPSGLKWRKVQKEAIKAGTELIANYKLSDALTQTTKFSTRMWKSFWPGEPPKLRSDHFVKVEITKDQVKVKSGKNRADSLIHENESASSYSYFQPVATESNMLLELVKLVLFWEFIVSVWAKISKCSWKKFNKRLSGVDPSPSVYDDSLQDQIYDLDDAAAQQNARSILRVHQISTAFLRIIFWWYALSVCFCLVWGGSTRANVMPLTLVALVFYTLIPLLDFLANTLKRGVSHEGRRRIDSCMLIVQVVILVRSTLIMAQTMLIRYIYDDKLAYRLTWESYWSVGDASEKLIAMLDFNFSTMFNFQINATPKVLSFVVLAIEIVAVVGANLQRTGIIRLFKKGCCQQTVVQFTRRASYFGLLGKRIERFDIENDASGDSLADGFESEVARRSEDETAEELNQKKYRFVRKQLRPGLAKLRVPWEDVQPAIIRAKESIEPAGGEDNHLAITSQERHVDQTSQGVLHVVAGTLDKPDVAFKELATSEDGIKIALAILMLDHSFRALKKAKYMISWEEVNMWVEEVRSSPTEDLWKRAIQIARDAPEDFMKRFAIDVHTGRRNTMKSRKSHVSSEGAAALPEAAPVRRLLNSQDGVPEVSLGTAAV